MGPGRSNCAEYCQVRVIREKKVRGSRVIREKEKRAVIWRRHIRYSKVRHFGQHLGEAGETVRWMVQATKDASSR